jgi:C1A family cysteine protease
MIACMAIYRDFFGYKDGVYRHVTGDLAGYHAISCIGYSEEEECWICKNSWNTDWGNQGFFKIAYGGHMLRESGVINLFQMLSSQG